MYEARAENEDKQDYVQARFWCEKAALQDHVLAQVMLGSIYLLGRVEHQDYVLPGHWIARAGALDRSAGCDLLNAVNDLKRRCEKRKFKRVDRELLFIACDGLYS